MPGFHFVFFMSFNACRFIFGGFLISHLSFCEPNSDWALVRFRVVHNFLSKIRKGVCSASICLPLFYAAEAFCAPPKRDGWLSFRRDFSRVGVNRFEDIRLPLKLKWTYPGLAPGAIYTSPVMARGKVYVGELGGRFLCLEAKGNTSNTTELVWSRKSVGCHLILSS